MWLGWPRVSLLTVTLGLRNPTDSGPWGQRTWFNAYYPQVGQSEDSHITLIINPKLNSCFILKMNISWSIQYNRYITMQNLLSLRTIRMPAIQITIEILQVETSKQNYRTTRFCNNLLHNQTILLKTHLKRVGTIGGSAGQVLIGRYSHVPDPPIVLRKQNFMRVRKCHVTLVFTNFTVFLIRLLVGEYMKNNFPYFMKRHSTNVLALVFLISRGIRYDNIWVCR